MKSVYLLDCTLRDGGYINDWNFGHDVLRRVFERLVSSKIDFIEIGFLDDRRIFDKNRSIMPSTECVDAIWGDIDKGNSSVAGMIDYGTCDIRNLKPKSESYLDAIRVIFKKQKMYPAIDFCKQVKELGYKVFTNCVSITSYNDDELKELTRIVNDLEPFALSMVDTYGILHQDILLHIYDVLNEYLLPSIKLAFHGHNNFQMGYANSLAILNRKSERDVIVDGTLFGMGKSAGNAPVELLAMYMNERFGKQYDLSQIIESIDTDIMDIFRKSSWGYKPFYFIAAMNKCHPDYVAYLMNKNTLSIKSINEVLARLEGEKKLLYDSTYIESLYLSYQKNECDDSQAFESLRAILHDQPVLLVGPGSSIMENREKINSYISKNKPVVIPINSIPDSMSIDYLFLTNRRRYSRIHNVLLSEKYKKMPIIATSNVISTAKVFDYVLNYSNLIDPNTEIQDNSMVMLLKAMIRCGVKNIAMAGFDGYSANEMNYADTNMEYSFVKEKAEYLNKYAENFFAQIKDVVTLKFITPTKYKL